MIIYNTKSWRGVIVNALGFGDSYNARELFKIQLSIFLYSTLVTLLRIHVFGADAMPINLDTTFLSLIGVILGLTLVFRINSSYDRWWEGRKQWGALINDSRTMASNFNCLIPKEDTQTRRYIAAQIANFAYALKGHLRDHIDFSFFDPTEEEGYIEELKQAKHVPHKIASLIFIKMEALYKSGLVSEADKINIKGQIEQLINILGACERIKNSPIPYSHTSFIKSFIFFYALFLPIGLVDKFEYYTIPAVFLISYALAGVEVISEEIEQPFGKDANDLPLRHLANVIKQNVYEAMDVPLDQELPSPLVKDAVVI
ncbi:MAG: bestrophin family protein [Thermonemataceae bacterium]